MTEEKGFNVGDIVYLDVSEFTSWKNASALMYINFSDASKDENNGKDIKISSANSSLYDPKKVSYKVSDNIYAYIITAKDAGENILRFWRGNSDTLWNCSITLSYSEYEKGNNCIKIKGWNNSGSYYNGNYSIDYDMDTDGDGLSDYLEAYIGTDKDNTDTDSDKLKDGEEYYFTATNPLKYDSLVSGISDYYADTDKDGLSNYEELNIGTNPNDKDTDLDGLNDGEEVNEIKSNPTLEDTDGDTLNDGDDVALGFSPLLSDTDSDGILDCDERIYQEINLKIQNEEKKEVTKVEVGFEGTGYIESTTTIEDIYGRNVMTTNTVGLVGVPIEITSTSVFDTATICFTLNSNIISEEEIEDLMIMWYDEENDIFVPQITAIDSEKMTVSATVTHFSKYLVVDKSLWYDAWKNAIQYESGENYTFETVIAIDCSGSMSGSDPNFEYTYQNTLFPGSELSVMTCNRKLAAENYIKAQKDNDKTAIVLFESSAYVACSLTDSKTTATSALNTIYSSGGTNFEAAVNTSVEVLKSADKSSKKMILFLSDGESSISESALNYAVANDIVINSVYIGSGSDNSLLKHMSEKTGGEYFKATTADELIKIYNEISLTQKIDSKDTDGDGLPDVFEVSGMMLSDGSIIHSDPFLADTDGDGLKDGEEVSMMPAFYLNKFIYKLGGTVEVGAYVFNMKSNPKLSDTDGDGLLDGKAQAGSDGKKIAPKDPNPTEYDGLLGMWKEHIKQAESEEKVAHKLDSFYDIDLDNPTPALGALLCWFMLDEKEVAVHSQIKTWQSIGGYNNVYDNLFNLFTRGNMEPLKFRFSYDKEEYIIWAWKGDYLNLGSGAEIGIYQNPHEVKILGNPFLSIEQWDVADFTLPMSLYLYNYYSSRDIDMVFGWEPEEEQWWITGFDPRYDNPIVDDMVVINSIDFSKDKGMYEALKKAVYENEQTEYMIFDEEEQIVWFVWN